MRTPLTDEELQDLGAFSTPTICNAIETFAVRPRNEGFMDASIVCRFPDSGAIAGYAVTATMRSAAPPERDIALGDIVRVFEGTPKPWIVVVEDLDLHPLGAIWGEVNATAFGALGAVAAVTNGGVRDLPGVRAVGFQLYSASVLVSHAYAHFVTAGEPVRVGGLRVAPGDLLHCDAHGVASIPLEIAREVPAAARKIEEAERRFIDYARSGQRDNGELLRRYGEVD
jgi:regulator of RNase E activity RraA